MSESNATGEGGMGEILFFPTGEQQNDNVPFIGLSPDGTIDLTDKPGLSDSFKLLTENELKEFDKNLTPEEREARDASYFEIEAHRLQQQLSDVQTRLDALATKNSGIAYRIAYAEHQALQAQYRRHLYMAPEHDLAVWQDLPDFDLKQQPDTSPQLELPRLKTPPNYGMPKFYSSESPAPMLGPAPMSGNERWKHLAPERPAPMSGNERWKHLAPEQRPNRLASLQRGLGHVARVGASALHTARAKAETLTNKISHYYEKSEVKARTRFAALALGIVATAGAIGIGYSMSNNSEASSPRLAEAAATAVQPTVPETAPITVPVMVETLTPSAAPAPEVIAPETPAPETTMTDRKVTVTPGDTVWNLVEERAAKEGAQVDKNGKVLMSITFEATEKVLKLNNLTWKTARMIHAGQDIIMPDDLLASPQS